ncbi:GPW/gp25 family protein [Granulicella arctica]|uniref:GPW/gp25 family protein n=1 Tax=Granulicella arctica TaxID=940613 RepID=UPI0021E03B8B|nr:GPW/gp25 family protein [Granulicella arctica]
MNIDFPFHFDGRGQTTTADLNDHVREMLEQLIFTVPGERVNRPDFGSAVSQLLFAPNSPELAATVQFSLHAAIQRWLGDILDLQDVTVASEDSSLTITVAYVIRQINQQQTATFVRTT